MHYPLTDMKPCDSVRSAMADRAVAWLERALRKVLPSPRRAGPETDVKASPKLPGRSKDAAARGQGQEQTDAAGDSSLATTLPMTADASGWMMSSMDLMTGVEIVEGDKPQPEEPDAEPGRDRPGRDRA